MERWKIPDREQYDAEGRRIGIGSPAYRVPKLAPNTPPLNTSPYEGSAGPHDPGGASAYLGRTGNALLSSYYGKSQPQPVSQQTRVSPNIPIVATPTRRPVGGALPGRAGASATQAPVVPVQPAPPPDPLAGITMNRGGMQSQGNAMPEGYALDMARRRAQMSKPTSPFDSYEGTEFMRKISGMIDNLNLQRGYAPTTLNSRRRAAFMASNDARIDNAIGQLTNALGGAFTEKGKFYEGVNRDTLGYDQSMYGHDVQDRNYAAVNRNAANRYALDLRKLDEVEIPAMRSHSQYERDVGYGARMRPEATMYGADRRAEGGGGGRPVDDTAISSLAKENAGDPEAGAQAIQNYRMLREGYVYQPGRSGGIGHKDVPGGLVPPKTVVKTGFDNKGRKVILYADGTSSYAK